MEVNPFDQLGLIAQVSATLLGFIAVFIVLSNRDGRFAESDRHFVQALVCSAAYAFFLALIPGTLSFFMAEGFIWMTSLVVAFLVGSASAIIELRAQLRMSEAEAKKIHWGWHFVAWGLGVIIIAQICLGLFGLASPVAMYIGVVTVSVVLALWSYIAVVFRKFF